MQLDPRILAYYDAGEEHARLTTKPSLERIRTEHLLRRFLPPPPARLLDVGGGSGVYAAWLAELGYEVRLVDPVPLHVEQASSDGRFSATVGDARDLRESDASYDGALLLGPLYHLIERDDRVLALTEARRVVGPAGVVVAAAISRYASTFDGFFRDFVDRPGFVDLMREDLRSGQHRNADDSPGLFTTAFFHTAAELTDELGAAGLTDVQVLPVEGPLMWAASLAERLADPVQRRLVLEVLSAMESDPAVLGATGHLLAVGRG